MKNNIIQKILLLCLLGFTITLYSCDKEEIDVFTSDDAGVYFQYVSSWEYGTGVEYYNDSITYSFASASPSSTGIVLSVDIKTLGKVRDYDRPVKVVIDSEKTTAVNGVHYEANLDTLKIPAGQSSIKVRITFLRTPELLKNKVKLALKLEENEHFKLHIKEYKNTNAFGAGGKSVSSTNFSFTVSETYTIPSYWEVWGDDFFGTWTPNKFVYVNEVLGFTVSDWKYAGSAGSKIAYGRFSFFALTLKGDLQERANSGNPMREADGSFMQLGPAYQVDYSAYE